MGFSEGKIQKVWEKGGVVQGYGPEKYRKDACGAWIQRDYYGNRGSVLGWEIDHIKPKDIGGTDDLSNLRPLQWKNNVTKQDGRLTCPVVASGNTNIDRI